MTQFERGVKEVIAQNSRYTVREIRVTDSLDKFISPYMAGRLARELKRKFMEIDTTEVTNALYISIKTVADLISVISSYHIDAR